MTIPPSTPEATTVTEARAVPVTVTEEDLPPSVRTALAAARDGQRVYGGSDRPFAELLNEALPTAIANRLRRIIPPDFALAEMQMKFSIDAKIFGAGCSADVTVKLTPK